MYVGGTRRRSYSKQTLFDVLSAAAGLAVIAVGVVSFIDPEKYAYLFPVEFLLASIFQCLLAVPRLSDSGGRHSGRKKAWGICLYIAAGILLMIAIVSAVCLWR